MATELASLAEPSAGAGMSGAARAQSSIGAGIVLRDVVKSYGDFRAADCISLDVRPGEFITLLGPSGSGKTTLLNLIAGFQKLDGGELHVDGAPIDHVPTHKRGFGMVFQSYALFPHMSVRKNVGFGLAMQGIKGPEAEKRIRDALAMVRLESQADKLPGQLSGGQQQRVAIARAIVIRPPIVLMDEPLSNLDAKLRLEMRAEIRAIHDQIGSTTIYVTHDQDEALSLADRIVVMSQGHIQQVGTPEELYQRPVNLTVADFMGFRTRMPGRIVSVTGDEAEIEVDGSRFRGLARESMQVGQSAVLAIRPEDLVASATGPGIAATVVSIEYRGRAFFGLARTAAGAELYFRADEPLSRGASAYLSPAPGRALIFREDAA